MREEYRARRDLLCKGLSDIGFSFPVPEGAFYAFSTDKAGTLQKIIDNGVILTPGSAFVRSAGLSPAELCRFTGSLVRALDRIKKATGE